MRNPQVSRLANLPRLKLEALVNRAQQALAVLRDREIKTFADKVKGEAKELGIEIADIVRHLSGGGAERSAHRAQSVPAQASPGRRGRRPAKGKKVKPWFRDAQGNTWSGRGTPARFIREHVAAGGKLSELLVDESKADEAKRIEAKLGGKKAAKKRGAKNTNK